MRYKLSEIAAITGGRLHGEDREVRGVTCDSRSFVAGDDLLFVAMKGVNHNSHQFIPQMAARGVKAFMVEESMKVLSHASYISVTNSIEALQRLAAHHRANFSGVVVGITGSNGKTTIKEWMAQTAPQNIKLFRSPRSYNSQLGVALSLLMIEGDEDLALIEAGISRPREMERLWSMIRPDIAVITSIGEAHQEGFESMAQKVEEKLILTRNAKQIIYHGAYSDLTSQVLYLQNETTEIVKIVDAAEVSAASAFSDIASQRNSQIVTALHHALGYSAPRFDNIQSVAMRLEVVEGVNNSMIINDSYSSDINSLHIALDTLQSIAGEGCKTVILSDILQSGAASKELYGGVAEAIKRAGVTRLIGVGAEISKWGELFDCDTTFYATTDELLHKISSSEYANQTVLIKGNRGCQFEKIGHALAYKSHTTTLEVDLNAMVHNLNYYRSKLNGKTKITAMVKANSYGAGDVEVAQTLQHEGVDYLAVAFADEGALLRDKGITMPIIVLNADDGSFAQMVDSRLEPEIYSFRSLEGFAAAIKACGERNYPIHIKLDTGMHRLGFMEEQIPMLISKLKELQGTIRLSSIFSHLSSADMGAEGEARTAAQIARFSAMSGAISSAFDYPIIRHIANSAAITNYPQAHFDMCRLGIGLYGFGEDEEALQPISTLKTRIVQIRTISQPECVGYGAAGVIDGERRIATIPIGYADGMNRHLGNGAWSLLVGGCPAPIIGRICMDSLMVDITGLDGGVTEGDEVVIFSPKAGNRASDMARVLDTITYEVLTSVSSRVKRIYLKE